MADDVKPVEIQLDPQSLEEIQKAKGNITLIRGHISEGKLTLTGIQHIIPSPFAHNWPGGNAFNHEWPSGSDE